MEQNFYQEFLQYKVISYTMTSKHMLVVVMCLLLTELIITNVGAQDSSPKSTAYKKARDIDSKVIKMGVILPFEGNYPWVLPKVGPAIELAIHAINKLNILPGYTFNTYYGDSQCSETYGPLEAIEMYANQRVHVFIGPACDYSVAPVARYSPYWNIPVITGGALADAFKDKEQYRLLTRTSGSYSKLAQFFTDTFSHFNWNTPGLIYSNPMLAQDGKNNCHFVAESIYQGFKAELQSKHVWYQRIVEDNPQGYNLSAILMDASRDAKNILLCTSPDTVRDIMITASDLGLDNGEYVFLNIDIFSSQIQSETPWFREKDTHERNEKAKKAYEALMMVTVRKPASVEYKQFSEEVKSRARMEYEDFTFGDEEVNSYVGDFHDAVILYALGLNQTLRDGYTATDGAEITRRMWNTSFTGITGTVSIDENGDRDADYSLFDLNPTSGKFEVVGNYFGKRKVWCTPRRGCHSMCPWPSC